MKNGKAIAICFILCLVVFTQQSWSENVDTNAAYMTVFGRPATAAEISYWQNRLPATQAELVQINLSWLVSARGAGELVNVVNRGFQAALSRQPSAAELQDWQTKIKTEKLTYSSFVSALKGNPNTKLKVYKIPSTPTYKEPTAPKVEKPSAFLIKTTAPVVISCPENVSMMVGAETYALKIKRARFVSTGFILCEYSPSQTIQTVQPGGCSPKLGVTAIIGPDPSTTTSVAEGCKEGLAFCADSKDTYSGELSSEKTGMCTYSSEGTVTLSHETSLTCDGRKSPTVQGVGYSADGKFLCW